MCIYCKSACHQAVARVKEGIPFSYRELFPGICYYLLKDGGDNLDYERRCQSSENNKQQINPSDNSTK